MKKTLPLLTFIVLFGSGCGLGNKSRENTVNTPVTTTSSTPVSTSTTSTVTKKPEVKPTTSPVVGKVTTLRLGQSFYLSFPLNPSTGYTWQIEQKPEGIVKIFDLGVTYPKNKGYGSEGTGRWKIAAQNAGKTTLTFKYVKSWEYTTAPEKTYTYTIVVK